MYNRLYSFTFMRNYLIARFDDYAPLISLVTVVLNVLVAHASFNLLMNITFMYIQVILKIEFIVKTSKQPFFPVPEKSCSTLCYKSFYLLDFNEKI